MKATGIVRRIDDLGRVVIPKEIRRTMRIREGDPLEIYTDRDGEVIFKKYSPIGELGDFAACYAESLAKTSGIGVCVTDRDNIIAVSGIPKKEFLEKLQQKADYIKSSRPTAVNLMWAVDKQMKMANEVQGAVKDIVKVLLKILFYQQYFLIQLQQAKPRVPQQYR